jgi:hypothetical protein
LLHRHGGLAIEDADGARRWYRKGKLHRIDGPAVEDADGSREWYRSSTHHREDGPAVERVNGDCEWRIQGVRLPDAISQTIMCLAQEACTSQTTLVHLLDDVRI